MTTSVERNGHISIPGGRFIAVVGPSGAGKDSVMAGMSADRPDLHRVRRVITRTDTVGEDFEAVSDSDFAMRVAAGHFALHWTAHGLSYGIPTTVHPILARGHDALANLSRGMLEAAAREFDSLVVLHITASPAILAQRLAQRGRETGDAITRRLERSAPALPAGMTSVTIDNSGPLQASISAALTALYPAKV